MADLLRDHSSRCKAFEQSVVVTGLDPVTHQDLENTKMDCRVEPGNDKLSPAPQRRHRHLVAAAGAAVDLLAGAELQVFAEADADFR